MPTLSVVVTHNRAGALAAALPALIQHVVQEQIDTTKTDVEDNIEKWEFIDTGAALGSVEATMTGPESGKVDVTARSPEGFNYPALGNYGGHGRAPRPFFTEAEIKAQREYPERMERAIESAL